MIRLFYNCPFFFRPPQMWSKSVSYVACCWPVISIDLIFATEPDYDNHHKWNAWRMCRTKQYAIGISFHFDFNIANFFHIQSQSITSIWFILMKCFLHLNKIWLIAAYFIVGNTKRPGNQGSIRLRDERGGTGVARRYRNKDITLSLPEGKTLRDIKWFSIYCEEYSVNFGDVSIPRNFDFPRPYKLAALKGVHGVSSDNIVVVDAQTILIPNFSYDGEAPGNKHPLFLYHCFCLHHSLEPLTLNQKASTVFRFFHL